MRRWCIMRSLRISCDRTEHGREGTRIERRARGGALVQNNRIKKRNAIPHSVFRIGFSGPPSEIRTARYFPVQSRTCSAKRTYARQASTYSVYRDIKVAAHRHNRTRDESLDARRPGVGRGVRSAAVTRQRVCCWGCAGYRPKRAAWNVSGLCETSRPNASAGERGPAD